MIEPPPFYSDFAGHKNWFYEVYKWIVFTAKPETVTSSPHTIGETSQIILVDDDTVGGAVTVILPKAKSLFRTYHVKKLGTTGDVEIQGGANVSAVCGIAISGLALVGDSENIDGAPTATLTDQYESVKLTSNSTDWFII